MDDIFNHSFIHYTLLYEYRYYILDLIHVNQSLFDAFDKLMNQSFLSTSLVWRNSFFGYTGTGSITNLMSFTNLAF